jgi:hypothetical protein
VGRNPGKEDIFALNVARIFTSIKILTHYLHADDVIIVNLEKHK